MQPEKEPAYLPDTARLQISKKLWDNPLLVSEEGFCRVNMSEEGHIEVYIL